MNERIRLIDHRGKQVLMVDFSNCPCSEVEKIARAVPDYVITQPRDSVLVFPISLGPCWIRTLFGP